MQTSPVEVVALPAPAPVEPEPSLGDVSFDEWFDTPVFESDTDERLEELAMSRRGPIRLAAGTLLRVNARTEGARSRRSVPERPARRKRDVHESALRLENPEGPLPPGEAPARPGLRGRVGPLLDRWAETEIHAQERLERLLLPRRWQLR